MTQAESISVPNFQNFEAFSNSTAGLGLYVALALNGADV
jgi:hypothetical protein